MRELVEEIAKALVDRPEDVEVKSVDGSQVTVLELRVHPEDLGKVIGRQGRTAKAIRILLGAAGMKLKKRYTLEILED
jgi:predicted RNA-binding protein YlqC (UPF0109 family)